MYRGVKFDYKFHPSIFLLKMLINNYGLAFIDGSWLLTRNLYITTKDKTIEEMDPVDTVRLTLQTISKLSKSWGITAQKIIIIWDKWSKIYGGYIRSWMLKDFVTYKGSRKFITERVLEEMKNDPNVTPEQLNAAMRELAISKIKFKAKDIMINEFPKIGICSYFYEGYEFDDIASLASFQLYRDSGLPNIIITKDSDLQYSTCPNCVWMCPPSGGATEPTIITYNDMYYKIPEALRNRGMSLYNYNAYMNAAGFIGHNDMGVSKKRNTDSVETILKILDGDYSDLHNKDMFEAQLKSYDLSLFPGINIVRQDIDNFYSMGHYGTLNDFHEFCMKNGVTQISDNYYTNMISKFDQKLFSH